MLPAHPEKVIVGDEGCNTHDVHGWLACLARDDKQNEKSATRRYSKSETR